MATSKHNHVTRDIRKRGQCPGCDEYHDSVDRSKTKDAQAARPSGYNAENRTDYVLSDGSTQVMEAVLAERKALTSLKGRKRMDAAFRLRAGMIGVLQSCLCDYPLERYATSSGHHESCSGHRIFLSLMQTKSDETEA
jgi:hypothetical protein